MFKPKTTISALFASPKGGIERDGRFSLRLQGADSVPQGVFDIIPLWDPLHKRVLRALRFIPYLKGYE